MKAGKTDKAFTGVNDLSVFQLGKLSAQGRSSC